MPPTGSAGSWSGWSHVRRPPRTVGPRRPPVITAGDGGDGARTSGYDARRRRRHDQSGTAPSRDLEHPRANEIATTGAATGDVGG